MSESCTRVLFLCMGNICRSPAAHCVFQHLVNTQGLSHFYDVDSAGTIGYHAGNAPDPRMQKVLKAEGFPVIGKSRPLTAEDFFAFDYILGMDASNLTNAQAIRPPKARAQLQAFSEYVKNTRVDEIPDPYYGDDGFQYVLNLVKDGCTHLLETLESKRVSG